ncbi:MAG: hypothetical protein ACD_37C00656G0003, partial [uncultured bacterium]
MDDLLQRIDKVIERINVSEKERLLKEIEAESMGSSFWKDSQKAAEKMKQIAAIQKEIESTKKLRELFDQGKLDEAEGFINEMETLLYFSGVYDKSSALVSIHAGQGGVEAMDWTQ